MYFVKLQLNDEIISLFKEIFPETLTDCVDNTSIILTMNGCSEITPQWVGLKHADGIVAFCTIGQMAGKCFIYNFGVVDSYRCQGYGQILLKSIVETYGFKDMYLIVNKNNRKAISLYRKFHFEYAENSFKLPKGELCYVRRHNE